jgi:hypothetical protein
MPLVVKHVTNKVDDTYIIFWIRLMVKVVRKSQWDKYFNTEGIFSYI